MGIGTPQIDDKHRRVASEPPGVSQACSHAPWEQYAERTHPSRCDVERSASSAKEFLIKATTLVGSSV